MSNTKNKYLIALQVGGLMEMPEFSYNDFDVIEANTKEEAVEKYNTKNNCSFFYGSCLAEKVKGKIKVLSNKVSYEHINLLKNG